MNTITVNLTPDQLPSSFNNEIISCSEGNYVIRSNITNFDLCDKWVGEFSELSCTSWQVRNTNQNSERFISRKDYTCHHSNFRKVEAAQNKRGKSKNINCPAKIKIIVKKTTVDTLKKDKFIKNGLVAVINILSIHSHSITTAEALSSLKVSEETKKQFESYFNHGLGITDAILFHEGKLELEGDESIIANASLNPKYRTVQYLHNLWRTLNLGPRIGDGVLEKLRSKMSSYNEKGIKILINEDPFSIVICTPLMQRAHSLPYSKDIVFADTTASCDAHNHAITFMLTPCAVRAIPLAVIVTKGQSFNDYKAGFELAKRCFGDDGFGGQQFPKIFMTDDSEAERQALKTVWPDSKQLLCRFHVCQSIWRWLWSNENNIEKSDRPILYNFFSKILNAPTTEIAEVAYNEAINTANIYISKYYNWIKYISSYWKRKQIWCLAYRNFETRGHQTNNFSEVCVRIYKDIILSRNKAYNIVSLVDFTCTIMEQYYIRRIRKFSNGRCDASRLFMNSMKKKIKYLSKENIKEIDDHMFKVPSETGDSMYEVYTDLGCCTCEYGRLGKFCKHQAAIYFYFGKELPNAPPVTAHCRHAMAALAFGNKVQPLSFYTSLNEITQTSEENSSIDTNTEQEGTKTKDNENSINEYKKHEVNSEISDNVVSTHIPLDDSSDLNGEEEFKKVINLMMENHSKYGSSTASTQMFLKKLKNVKTRNSWETFLATCGKQISFRLGAKSKIHVQPTSISRRRPEVTRGCKRLAVGRPPSDEKIKKSKRKRNLQHNIGKNQPNAKSH